MSVIRGTTVTPPTARDAVTDDTVVSKKPWSSKNTVDKLCPAFTESGSVVVCEPVEDYPLEVVSHINGSASGVTLQHYRGCIDIAKGDFTSTYIRIANKEWRKAADSWSVRVKCKPNTTYYISHLNPAETIFRVACVESFDTPFMNNISAVPVVNAVETLTNDVLTVTTTENTVCLIVQTSLEQKDITSKTLVVSEGVEFEHRIDFGKTVTGGEYNWSTGVLTDENGNATVFTSKIIDALEGENGFRGDCGNTTVSGKADPMKVIEKLNTEQNKQYELIEERTINADTNQVAFDRDLSGLPYNFSAITVIVNAPAASATASLIFKPLDVNGKVIYYHEHYNGLGTTARVCVFKARNDHGLCEGYSFSSHTGNANFYAERGYNSDIWANVHKFNIGVYPDTVLIPKDTVIKVFGIRG